MTINERLLEIIIEKFKTQTEGASQLLVSKQAMSTILKTGKFSIEFLMKLKKAVPEMNLNWLLDGEGEKYIGKDEKMYALVNDRLVHYGKLEQDMIGILKEEIVHLRGQVDFLQDQIKAERAVK
jgi:DNA-binding Xre family transcriptional regulator